MMQNQSYAPFPRQNSCSQSRSMSRSCAMPADGQHPAPSPAGRQRPMPACEQMSQEQLLRWVMLNKFACIDANLYLDTHPDDTEAIAYFQEHNRFYLEALDTYSRTYGPLTIAHAYHNDNYWDWVNQPWPWQ